MDIVALGSPGIRTMNGEGIPKATGSPASVLYLHILYPSTIILKGISL